ncbi:DUF2316 family protein [Companilactobacillus allii]|uniref:DUF2316 domain-containing protein n=1 Tax=Companilactobacillus allii TaxID=1847728 RepID=A0A1P8Q1Q7_9LACO|nr:DUF2316 family protein [Companilactobacillus allii]APX71765.1 hypothetical protein BTM29_03975 [Companilactobacillus allii]USQ68852.1 DUF2316 family protein [Companilactobacillus allii]
MSLTNEQRVSTVREFHENLEISGLTFTQMADDLGTTAKVIEDILNLNVEKIEDPWILRNYLIKKIISLNKEPVPFTALAGDYHDYWFLNSKLIDKEKVV